jgi:hypothetical protein
VILRINKVLLGELGALDGSKLSCVTRHRKLFLLGIIRQTTLIY